MNFRVDLDIFRGPLDLLLYLVRKHELDIADIPIAKIAEQFLGYLEVLQEIDINAVGDFLDMASSLIELKSRLVLPHGGEETDELLDPRADLVQQLLEYKKFKDAASLLDDRSREWQQHYGRLVDDLPPRQTPLADQPILEAELWDLVSAFGRIIRESQVVPTSSIVYDDTPIHVHMRRIHRQLSEDGKAGFSQFFAPGMHKSTLIGVFLSILELARHHSVVTEQVEGHGEIWIKPGEGFDPQWNLADIDTAKSDALAEKLASVNLPIKPR